MAKYAISTADGFLFEDVFDTIEEAQDYLERFYGGASEDIEGCIIYEIVPKLRVEIPPIKAIYKEI